MGVMGKTMGVLGWLAAVALGSGVLTLAEWLVVVGMAVVAIPFVIWGGKR